MLAAQKKALSYGLLQIAGTNQLAMVASATKCIRDRGGNIVTSQMLRFGRHMFAATLLISAEPDDYDQISNGLDEIQEFRPRLLKTHRPPAEEHSGALLYEGSVYAYDYKGLIAEVTAILSADDLDIVQLSSCTYPMPFDGQPLYVIEFIAESPNHLAAKRANANLESLAPHRGWDVYWRPILKSGLMIDPLGVFPPHLMASRVDSQVSPTIKA